jgi:hypothetical protein
MTSCTDVRGQLDPTILETCDPGLDPETVDLVVTDAATEP